jgi:hypothetical protein
VAVQDVLAPVPRSLRSLRHLRLLEAHRMSAANGRKRVVWRPVYRLRLPETFTHDGQEAA